MSRLTTSMGATPRGGRSAGTQVVGGTLVAMRILVVEDEHRLAGALKRGLQQEGYAVDIASEGKEGLWLATEQEYDAIVLDIMLPGLNGFQVCKSLREAGRWTPILMLTAKDGDLDHAEALDTGADDFLSKPFSLVVLLAHIRALLRRASGERPTMLQAGDLELDPASHRCRRGEVAIELSPRQFSLLEYLMRNKGDIVSKADILGHVWDFAFDGDPNIVEVYIAALRKRIDVPFGRNSIETFRLVGYRLDPDGG